MRKFGLAFLLVTVAQPITHAGSAETPSLHVQCAPASQSLLHLIQASPALSSCFTGCIQSESSCQFSCMAANPPTGNQQGENPQALPPPTNNTPVCYAQCSTQATQCRVGCGS